MAQDRPFRETQRLRQPWVWALIGLVSVPALVFDFAVGLLIVFAIAAFVYSVRLITEVRPDGLYVRFAPIHRSFRRLPFDEIERLERTEFGLLTYGGIGIRWTPDTVAYMTTTGGGIKIDRQKSKSVVVGSQDPSALLTAIDEFH
jgi:hypothetical protein